MAQSSAAEANQLASGPGIPETGGAIPRPAEQEVAVRRKRHADPIVLMTSQDCVLPARAGVPQVHVEIGSPSCQEVAVGVPGDFRSRQVGALREFAEKLAGGRVVDLDFPATVAGNRQLATVRMKGEQRPAETRTPASYFIATC